MSFSRAALRAAVVGLSAGPMLAHAQAPPPQEMPAVTVTANRARAAGPAGVAADRPLRAAADHREHRPAQDRRHHQHHRFGRRGEVPAEPAAAEAQLRRHAADAGDPHLGHQLQRPQPGLCRRHPDLGADLQQQHQRRAALGSGLAGGDQGRRLPLRPLLRRLAGQLDGRRAADHHPHARQARSDAQADRGAADIRLLQHLRHLHDLQQRRHDRQQGRAAVLLPRRQPRGELQPAARLRDQRRRLRGRHAGHHPGADQDRHGGQRRRRRRAAAQHHGQLQAQARRSTSPTG